VAASGQTARAAGHRRLAADGGLGVVAAVAVLVAGYALFARSLEVVVTSFAQPEFSHGYIVPLISGWILWQRRWPIWSRRGEGAWTGWAMVAAGAGLAVLCHAANLLTPPYVAALLVLVGLAAAALGWGAARLVIVPVAFLAFAYPLPDNLYIELSTTLQRLSSEIGAGLLTAAGVPVLLDGNIIDLGVMRLQVAEACSGLRYLLPLLTFGVLCAFLYRAPLWAKLAVIAATAPLAILLNGLRIALTGLLVQAGSPGLAEGFLHVFEGWVIFLLALAALFALMFALARLSGRSGTFVDMLDFDRIAGGAPPATAPAGTAPAAAVVAARPLSASVATLVVAALVLVPLAARPAVVPERPGLLDYPLAFDGWRGAPRFLDGETAAVLGADDYLLADFGAPGGGAVNLWVAYYDSLLDGSHHHSPTTCLPGAGWEYVALGPHRAGIVDLAGEPLTVNRGVVVKADRRIVMYFWMELRGRSVRSLQKVKFHNLWDSLVTGRSDGALVRIYTPLRPTETAADGDARLHAFLTRAYPHLDAHVGG